MLRDTTFELQPGIRTSFGAGGIGKLGKRIKAIGGSSAFIVTDPGISRAGVADRVRTVVEESGIRCRVFDEVTANPHVDCVHRGAELLRDDADAVVIALGGGSSMDAAKAIALVAPNGGTCIDYVFGSNPAKPGHRIVAVPTTAGTGSETNMFGVVTDPGLGRKILIAHASVLPVLVVLDPQLTLGVPAAVTATTGMDVLTHAIEAFTCKRANPVTDAVALEAIRMAGAYLPKAYQDGSDLEARAQMLLAAHLAGIAFTSAGLGMCHAMGHPLSARYDAAHGQTLASLLPSVMRFNKPACEVKYAQVAAALGVAQSDASDADNAERAIAGVETLRARVKTDRRIGDLGAKAADVPMLVEDAFADVLMMATPRFPEPRDVESIYRTLL
jgi:alcohol dehydrogenase class IV